MKCQRCGVNGANVSYTQIINGEKLQLVLCDKCAEELNIGVDFDFDFNDVFNSLLGSESLVKSLNEPEELMCDVCKTTYSDFAKTGMFGCENCYRVFGNKLDNVLKRLHGNNRHVGKKLIKSPETSVLISKKKKSELDELKEELQKCIKEERYEDAAIIRDKIKKIESRKKERGE